MDAAPKFVLRYKRSLAIAMSIVLVLFVIELRARIDRGGYESRLSAADFISEYSKGVHSRGRGEPVRVLVYTQYGCADCDNVLRSLDTLRRKYPEFVAVSRRLIPRTNNEWSDSLALVALCLYGKEDDFIRYDKVAAEKARVDSTLTNWRAVANIARLSSVAQIERCIAEENAGGETHRRGEQGKERFPLVFINGSRAEGDLSLPRLDSLVCAPIRSRVRTELARSAQASNR